MLTDVRFKFGGNRKCQTDINEDHLEIGEFGISAES